MRNGPVFPLAVALALLAAGSTWTAPPADSKGAANKSLDADHAAKMTKGLDLFKNQVRPMLLKHCVRCHGGKATEAEFDLTDRPSLLRGGQAGPAIIPGNAKDSLLYKLITHAKEPHMPHQRGKLAAADIAPIAAWIDLGAPYDASLKGGKENGALWTQKTVAADARQFWSFQPLKRSAPPAVRNLAWCRTPIDRFILAKLEAERIAPNPPVEKRRLLRRIYFDLVGLPPTPEEVDAFLGDPAPDALEKVVDRLLASPHHGERWARHWLDLARFAESHGFEHDSDRPTAYHYRDFVIQALNADLPYDTFVKWQLAGDELEPKNNLALLATGFLAAGVHSTQITKNEVERHRYDEMDDMSATVGTAMLGLTVGCARCHDHKFDPIPQADYYRLLSTFTTTVRTEIEIDLASDRTAKPHRVKALIASEGLPPVRLHTQGVDVFPETFFLRRGDPGQKEGVASQGFLQVLTASPEKEKHWRTTPPPGWRTSYRRRALAAWIADADQGAGHLLARVIVNRLWQHHMGRGIVATPSEFGNRSEPPTHPELLDWLATELIRHGWRLKPIHKLIVTSAVYAQSARIDEAKAKLDRANQWFWRRPPHRLEAEVLRDTLLAVSGALESRMHGPGTLDEGSRRRSIYFTVKRSKLMPMMQVFDAPDALGGIGDRPTTTIAPQALLLMNNPHVRAYAHHFARRVASVTTISVEEAIRQGYRIALARQPDANEFAAALAFVRGQMDSYQAAGKGDARELALADFCQILMCLNELVYVD